MAASPDNSSIVHGQGLRVGDTLGPYTIAEQVGAGGNSIVYRGRDSLLNRDVAIKQIRLGDGPSEEELRRNVRGEATLQKRVAADEPRHLVQLIEVVDEPRGLFLISEYVDGPSLERILAQLPTPMDLRQALGIVAAIAVALKSIHKHDVLHRDLKPANILLPRQGGLKVTDFGLATAMAEQQLMSAGSVRYMAPELLRGESADARADLYSLGIVAYEMLAGRVQFDKVFSMVLRDQRNQAMRWVKWHTNPRVKAPPLIELRPEIPPAVSDLIGRLMEKDPARRVPTAKDFISALRRHFAASDDASPQALLADEDQAGVREPVATSMPGDTAPLPPRSKLPWILGGLLGLWIVVGAGIGLVMLDHQDDALQQRGAQAKKLMTLGHDDYKAGRFDAALADYQAVSNAWPADTKIGHVARGGMMLAQSRLDMNQGKYDDALKNLNQLDKLGLGDAEEISQLIREAQARNAFATAADQIDRQIDAGHFTDARQRLSKWQNLHLTTREHKRYQALGAKLEDQVARGERQQLLDHANQLVKDGQREQAIALLTKAVVSDPSVLLQDRLAALKRDHAYEAAINDAKASQAQGDMQGAIAAYRRAQAIHKEGKVKRAINDMLSEAALQEGLALLKRGDAAGAQEALTRSLGYKDSAQAKTALAQIKSADKRMSFLKAGDEALAQKNYDAAIKQYHHAAAIQSGPTLTAKIVQATLAKDLKLGNDAIAAHKLDKAADWLKKAHDIAPNSIEVAKAMQLLKKHRAYREHLDRGNAARARSEFSEAKLEYRRAAAILKTQEVQRLLNEADYDQYLAIARAYIAAKEYTSAQAELGLALQIRRSAEATRLLQEVQQKLQQRQHPDS